MALKQKFFLAALSMALFGCADESNVSSDLKIISPGEYTVKENESLSILALRAYGDMELWYGLLNANLQISTRPGFEIEPGEVIIVPTIEMLDRSLPKSIFPESLPAEYIIMPGDSLTFIAKGCYGDPELWTRIYDANRNTLSERVKQDPRQIVAGEVLKIPAPPVVEPKETN